MNLQSNAVPGSSGDSQINESQAIAPAVVMTTRPFYWSVRRELWENRSIYVAPLAVAASLWTKRARPPVSDPSVLSFPAAGPGPGLSRRTTAKSARATPFALECHSPL